MMIVLEIPLPNPGKVLKSHLQNMLYKPQLIDIKPLFK